MEYQNLFRMLLMAATNGDMEEVIMYLRADVSLPSFIYRVASATTSLCGSVILLSKADLSG